MASAGVVVAATGRSGELLERGGQLAVLEEALAYVGRGGRGTVVVVSGEAGVGKTALLRSFCDGVARPQAVLWGTCDPLFTPRPLGRCSPSPRVPGASSGPPWPGRRPAPSGPGRGPRASFVTAEVVGAGGPPLGR